MATSERAPGEFGFKRLSVENWLTVDPAWSGVVMPSSLPDASEAWVFDIVRAALADDIPLSIRKLFETARGTLVYSLMFYPLLTLGSEQLFRVLEASVSLKCKELAAPPKIKTFEHKINWLAENGAMATEHKSRWHSIRHLRNDASHPRDQNIYGPAMALKILDAAVELVSTLFGVS
jgi:hypothetical protein